MNQTTGSVLPGHPHLRAPFIYIYRYGMDLSHSFFMHTCSSFLTWAYTSREDCSCILDGFIFQRSRGEGTFVRVGVKTEFIA